MGYSCGVIIVDIFIIFAITDILVWIGKLLLRVRPGGKDSDQHFAAASPENGNNGVEWDLELASSSQDPPAQVKRRQSSNGNSGSDNDSGSSPTSASGIPMKLPGHAVVDANLLVFYRVRAVVTALASLILVIVGSVRASEDPHVVHVDVVIDNLPLALDGYSIALVSDVHVGPTVGRTDMETTVAIVNSQHPDAVALVGDLVDAKVSAIGEDTAALGLLTAPDGVYFVTGNHEHMLGTSEVHNWVSLFESMGVVVLNNSLVHLPPGVDAGGGGNTIALAGVWDYSASGSMSPHVDVALSQLLPDEPVVLMAHQPEHIHEAGDARVDLQLSGHTHGGQTPPMSLATYLGNPYYQGYYRHSATTQIYVSDGVFGWGPRVRVGCQNEVTIVNLRVAQAATSVIIVSSTAAAAAEEAAAAEDEDNTTGSNGDGSTAAAGIIVETAMP